MVAHQTSHKKGNWIIRHWLHLTHLASVIFLAGVVYTKTGSRNEDLNNRLSHIESYDPEKIKIQVDHNTEDLLLLKQEAKTAQQEAKTAQLETTKLNVRLDQFNSKLDNILLRLDRDDKPR